MSKKILIVDDDELICEEISNILKSEGYCVNMAFDGLEANSLIKKNDYDLLLLDIKIPGISGLEILKDVKEKKIKTKVFILTGSIVVNKLLSTEKFTIEDKEDKDAGILKLADDIISKPFDVEMLLTKIKELIG